MKREDKFKQIAKEARAVLWALIAIIVFWIIAGLGISRLDITILHTPLWIITGCVGTWIFSVGLVIFLMRRVFKDFDLEEEDGDE